MYGDPSKHRLDDPNSGLLGKNILPLDPKDPQKIMYRASSYTIIGGQLYRRSSTEPLLRFLEPEEQRLALETVHEGICGEHLEGRLLAFKIPRQGFYWPTIRAEAHSYAKKCKQCQLLSTVPKQPPEKYSRLFSGHIEQLLDHPHERSPSDWLMGRIP